VAALQAEVPDGFHLAQFGELANGAPGEPIVVAC
jgi:hypothetical protein